MLRSHMKNKYILYSFVEKFYRQEKCRNNKWKLKRTWKQR